MVFNFSLLSRFFKLFFSDLIMMFGHGFTWVYLFLWLAELIKISKLIFKFGKFWVIIFPKFLSLLGLQWHTIFPPAFFKSLFIFWFFFVCFCCVFFLSLRSSDETICIFKFTDFSFCLICSWSHPVNFLFQILVCVFFSSKISHLVHFYSWYFTSFNSVYRHLIEYSYNSYYKVSDW